MSATSDSVTTVSPSDFTGRSKMSSAVSMTLGTFTAMRPAPVSSEPAAIRRLLRSTVLNSCSVPT